MDNTPIYEFEDAINFIAEKCDVAKDIIEKSIATRRRLYAKYWNYCR